MKKLLIIFLFSPFFSFSQRSLDLNFVKHLSDTEFYKECLFEIDRGDISLCIKSKRDSLFFYKGWSLYSIKNLKASATTLLKVSSESSFYEQSRLFASYDYIHIGEYNKANKILNYLKSTSIVSFEKSGILLIQRRYDDFNDMILKIDTTKYYLSKQVTRLYEYRDVMRNYKHKSPLLAAGMSTIVPGLGKVYAGKLGEGISSFLSCAALSLVTIEQYNKNGIKDYRTIISGALFSLFYIGNVWGSYFTVLVTEKEFSDEYKNKILLNIHIPLRTIFK